MILEKLLKGFDPVVTFSLEKVKRLETFVFQAKSKQAAKSNFHVVNSLVCVSPQKM